MSPLLPSTCRDKTKRNPLIRRRNLRAGILFCPGYFISRAKESIWGPSLLPREELFNPTRELWGFLLPNRKEKPRKMQHRTAHCASDGNRQSEQGERNGEAQKFLKVMPINTNGACDPNEPLPREDWGAEEEDRAISNYSQRAPTQLKSDAPSSPPNKKTTERKGI